MKALLLPSSLAVLLLSSSASAANPLDSAQKLLTGGHYEAATKAFAKLGKKGLLGLARTQLARGRAKKAAATAQRAARGKERLEALTLVGEAQRAAGDLKGAEAVLRPLVKKDRKAYRARALLGVVYHEQGKLADAKALFDGFYDDFGADKIDKTSAAQLTYVAIACRYTDNFRDAHDTLRDALKVDAKYVEAWLELAEISLEKYEAGHAEQHYAKVLAINPNNVRALIGMARVKQVQSNRLLPLMKLMRKVQQIDPLNAEAAAIVASTMIDNDDYARADKMLKEVLVRHPRHLESLSVYAASRYLQDDLKGYRAHKKKILALNKHFSRLFLIVMRLAERKHRYKEAIALGKEALKVNASDPYAMAEIGINYLRLGEEKEGLSFLKRAWQGDQYNVRNYNILNLYEDVLAKEYVMVKSKHFRLRVHKDERELLSHTVLPLLEEGFALYKKKYSYTPTPPITVELYKNPSHFAIRTFGLPPDPGALGGVCFGRVITAMSPTLRRFNWGQVLWHELNHVFTVELSRHRVPRWLTEGLAVMEPPLRRREWKRENDLDIYQAIRSNRLAGLAEINSVFTRRGLHDVLVAYYQGGLMADFFVQRWGIKKMRRALVAYGQGKRSDQLLPRIYGKSLAEFDTLFRNHQLKRLAAYGRGYLVDLRRFDKLAPYQKSAKLNARDAQAQAELAAALLFARKAKAAQKQAEATLKLDPKQKLALYVLMQLSRGDKERGFAQSLIVAGGDGYEARLALGRYALAKGKLKEGQQQLDAAKRFAPEERRPYDLLARAYLKAKRNAEAIREMKRVVELNQQSFGAALKLLTLLEQAKDWQAIRRYGQMAYYIFPASAKVHTLMGRAYEQQTPKRDFRRAAWHLELALLCNPKDKKPIHRDLARLYNKLGQQQKAKEHAQAAK